MKYSYAQLSTYRDRVADLLLGQDPQLQFLDLDERANSITLGYSGNLESVVARVRRDLALTEQSGDWVRAERVAPARPDTKSYAATSASMLTASSLTGQADTIVAGLVIHRALASGYKGCTLGFTAKRNNVIGFVTNSHCTEDMYGTGGTYNSFGQTFTRTIGTESVDPSGYTCGALPPTECCGADAAFIQSNGAVPYRIGFIAKPSSRNTGNLTVSLSDPYIRIASTGTAVAGMTVEKIGAVTGWTSGAVTHTCVTAMIQEDSWFKRVACADKALYAAENGDSGSPVFLWLPYNPSEGGVQAGLLGIHSSGEIEGNSKYFSRIDRIESDLGGSWEYLGPVPPSPLQAHIWGWTDVLASGSCQLIYSAHATGGAGGYSFSSMTTDGVIVSTGSNSITVAFPSAGSHWVSVTVTDAASTVSTATFTVQADGTNFECYGAPPGNPF
ncbi:MAG: hypothetical protein C0516_15905 [Gemmatimonas sp.]|nr:hypothetical protein [Gemmatimonas sp.]